MVARQLCTLSSGARSPRQIEHCVAPHEPAVNVDSAMNSSALGCPFLSSPELYPLEVSANLSLSFPSFCCSLNACARRATSSDQPSRGGLRCTSMSSLPGFAICSSTFQYPWTPFTFVMIKPTCTILEG